MAARCARTSEGWFEKEEPRRLRVVLPGPRSSWLLPTRTDGPAIRSMRSGRRPGSLVCPRKAWEMRVQPVPFEEGVELVPGLDRRVNRVVRERDEDGRRRLCDCPSETEKWLSPDSSRCDAGHWLVGGPVRCPLDWLPGGGSPAARMGARCPLGGGARPLGAELRVGLGDVVALRGHLAS